MFKREKDFSDIVTKNLISKEVDKLRAQALNQYPQLEKVILFYLGGNSKVSSIKITSGSIIFISKRGIITHRLFEYFLDNIFA